MPLPAEVVDLVFGKLSVTYGHRFLSIWDGMPIDAVKADWAIELQGVREDRILWLLQNLPERAPDAPTFRQLCARMPEPHRAAALEAPKHRPPPAAVAEAFARLAEPIDDKRPEKVRIAERRVNVIKALDRPLSPQERSDLEFYERILARHQDDANLSQRKAETQELVDNYAAGPQA